MAILNQMEKSTHQPDLALTMAARQCDLDPTASFESVLAYFIEQHEAGRPVRLDEIVARFPQHAEPLRSFAANQIWLDPSAESERGALIGECLDDFLLTHELARGGMGTVYAAVQQSLRREVAVKLISDGLLADADLKLRFHIEAEAAAALSHPNILPIHAIGCWRGMDYFVMPLVSGESLQAVVHRRHHHLERISGDSRAAKSDAQRDTICTAVTQVRDIARAVAYAHRRGIIHRDIKPDNILVDDDGQPKIVDFGLAKWHRDEPGMTRDGQIIGTPHYMSPEQARGESDVTAATDIYSLGGILFALLTEVRLSMSKSALSSASLLGYFMPRLFMLIGIGWTIHDSRDGCWMPRGVAERPVWSIWLGYLAALTMVNVLWAAGYFDHADVMVLAALMSGFGFLAMAGHLWGGNVISGAIFFVVAGLSAVWPRLSPLLLGSGWLIAMWILGRRYAAPANGLPETICD